MTYQLMPDQTPEEYQALKEDIRTRGVLVPVEVDETGAILDGHHRVRAWQELRAEGIAVPDYPRMVRAGMTEAEKRNHVRTLNILRRNLTKNQRDQLIADMLKDGMSTRQVAEVVGVSNATVSRAGVTFVTPGVPIEVLGSDGKKYSSRQREKPVSIFASSATDEKRAVTFAQTMPDLDLDRVATVRDVARSIQREQREQTRSQRQAEAAAAGTSPDWLLIGDFREVGSAIANDSVDLIFTDPPYDKEAAALYLGLSNFAARVLRPGGICIAYSGQMHLPEVYAGMGQHLHYMWTCAIGHSGGATMFRKWRINNQWKPLVMFGKPPICAWWETFLDDFTSGGREKDAHPWQQAVSEAMHFISSLCPAHGLVCDPFLGGGTSLVAAKLLGLRYVGIEIDPATAHIARRRIEDCASASA